MTIKSLIEKKLDEIGKGCGKENWDSYGAPGIKPKVIKRAKEIFGDIFICPVADGSVELSFHDEQIIISIEDNGSIHVILLDKKIKVDRV